jgi:threonine dehydrogenase-like Zn-dependent dehydrogenase
MRALVFDKTLRLVDDHPRPEPRPGEALVRVSLAGICNTDMEITKGYQEFRGVPGHEFVGVVESVADAHTDLLGKRVVGEINIGCGVCEYCQSGLGNHCPRRTVLGIIKRDGAMAEYLTLPIGNLHEVPDRVPDEEAVFTEPLAAAFEILEQVEISPDHSILVMGDGKLGILCALALRLTGADVTLLGKHENKLKIAGDQGVKTLKLGDMGGDEYDMVVEATGSAGGFETALTLVRPRGAIVLKSTVAESREMNLAPVVINEITLIGSRCGPFETALQALAEKKIDVTPLITETFSIGEAEQAFEKARERDSLKVLIDFS